MDRLKGLRIGKEASGTHQGEDQMAKGVQKITLLPPRDIAFGTHVMSRFNVRKFKSGVFVEELAEDIARRCLRGTSFGPW